MISNLRTPRHARRFSLRIFSSAYTQKQNFTSSFFYDKDLRSEHFSTHTFVNTFFKKTQNDSCKTDSMGHAVR